MDGCWYRRICWALGVSEHVDECARPGLSPAQSQYEWEEKGPEDGEFQHIWGKGERGKGKGERAKAKFGQLCANVTARR